MCAARQTLLLCALAAFGVMAKPSSADLLKELVELRSRLDRLESQERDKSPSVKNKESAPLPAALKAEEIGGLLGDMWALICGTLVFFMQPGFALLQAGRCRSKSLGTVTLKVLLCACIAPIVWYLVGYGIAFGVPIEGDANAFMGVSNFVGDGFEDSGHYKNWFLQLGRCATVMSIVSGGVAERATIWSLMIFCVSMIGIIYPCITYWSWSGSGWLTEAPDSYSDFAGSGVVHLTAGAGALVGAIALGPREGRFNGTQRPGEFDAGNLGHVGLGTFILWFGWYGLNCGAYSGFSNQADAISVALVAMNTTMAACGGGLASLCLRKSTFGVPALCNGILAGLVAVGAGANSMTPFAALITGVFGAASCVCGSAFLKRMEVDDPMDAFPIHGCAGIMGVLVRPLLDRTGVNATMWAWHWTAIFVIVSWSGGLSALTFLALRFIGCFRCSEEEEFSGNVRIAAKTEASIQDVSVKINVMPVVQGAIDWAPVAV
jgi:Amt family ammonium transporter